MHTRFSGRQYTRFDEYRALMILQYCFPEHYCNLTLAESPDLQDYQNQVGVEITSAMKGQLQEALSRAVNISGKKEEELDKNDIQNINQNRITVKKLPNDIYIAGTHAVWGSCFDFKTCLVKKTKKLNSAHFERFQENNLFIFAWMADDDDIEEAIQIVLREKDVNRYPIKYDGIFIFREQSLTEIDTDKKQVRHYAMPRDRIHLISEQAKAFITSKESL